MSSFMRAAGHRLTSLVRTSTSISLADRQRSACRPDELNGVGIDIDPRCGHRVSSMARRHPEARTTSSRGGGWLPWALGLAGSGPLPLHNERLWVAGRFLTTEIKREPPDHKSVGVP